MEEPLRLGDGGAARNVFGDAAADLFEQLSLVPILEVLERVGIAQSARDDTKGRRHARCISGEGVGVETDGRGDLRKQKCESE